MSATQPVQQPQQVPADYPGKTLGIVGLVLAIVGSVVGLIISIVAFKQSKDAGYPNGLAKAGIIIGIITTVLTIAYVIGVFVFAATMTPQMSR